MKKIRFSFPSWFSEVLVTLGLTLFFFGIRFISLTLFHAFGDLFSIVVAFTIFVLGWNARRFTRYGYLPFLGVAFLAIAAIDTGHLLISVRADFLSLQASAQAERLWIFARMAQASAMLLAPFFFRRRANTLLIVGAYCAVTLLSFAYLFRGGVFPMENIRILNGLRLAGRAVDLVVLLAFAVAGLLFIYRRHSLEPRFYRLSILSILFGMTAQVNSIVTGITYFSDGFFLNRLLLMLSFYMIFKAVIDTGFQRPYDFLFQDLKEQKDLLQDVVDINPSALAIITGPDQVYRMANQAYRDLTPHPEIDPIGRTFPEVWEDKERVPERQNLIQQAMETGKPVITEGFQLDIPGRERRFLNIHIRPTTWRGEPAVLAALWDITKLKLTQEQAQEAAQEANLWASEMETLMDAVPAIVMVALDPQGNRVIGNRAAYNLFRLSEGGNLSIAAYEETENKPFWLMKDGRNVPVQDLPVQTAIRLGRPLVDYEADLVFRDGTVNHLFGNVEPLFDENNQPRGAIAAFLDITRLVQVEKALSDSEALYRSLVDSIDDMIYTVDLDLRHTSINEKPLERFGMTGADFLGKTIAEILGEEAGAEHMAAYQRTLRGEHVEYEWTLQWGDSLIDYQTSLSPIRGADGSITGVVGVGRDITRLRQAETELERYAAQLERSNRELEQFAYVASHDLQEPLRKIRFFGEQLKTKNKDTLSEEEADYVERMLAASRRMQAMIDDLLTYSRVTTKAQPFVAVDVKKVAEEVVYDLETRIHQSHGSVEIGDLPVIEADPLQIHRLLLNLVGNALKYHRPDTPPHVTVSGESDDKNGDLRILVEDNGIGFDEQYLERIFRPFERLHGRSEYEGSGMGLAICQKIAERHGGTITARSRPHHGSTFVVVLPRKRSKERNQSEESAAPESAAVKP